MRRVILIILVALIALSCSKNKNAKLVGKIEGATDGTVILKILEVSSQRVLDTLKVKSKGEFSHSVTFKDQNPSFYYLYYKEKQIASMVLLQEIKLK